MWLTLWLPWTPDAPLLRTSLLLQMGTGRQVLCCKRVAEAGAAAALGRAGQLTRLSCRSDRPVRWKTATASGPASRPSRSQSAARNSACTVSANMPSTGSTCGWLARAVASSSKGWAVLGARWEGGLGSGLAGGGSLRRPKSKEPLRCMWAGCWGTGLLPGCGVLAGPTELLRFMWRPWARGAKMACSPKDSLMPGCAGEGAEKWVGKAWGWGAGWSHREGACCARALELACCSQGAGLCSVTLPELGTATVAAHKHSQGSCCASAWRSAPRQRAPMPANCVGAHLHRLLWQREDVGS